MKERRRKKGPRKKQQKVFREGAANEETELSLKQEKKQGGERGAKETSDRGSATVKRIEGERTSSILYLQGRDERSRE